MIEITQSGSEGSPVVIPDIDEAHGVRVRGSWVTLLRPRVTNDAGPGITVADSALHVTIDGENTPGGPTLGSVHDTMLSSNDEFGGILWQGIGNRYGVLRRMRIDSAMGGGVVADGKPDYPSGPRWIENVIIEWNEVTGSVPRPNEANQRRTGFGIVITTGRHIIIRYNLSHHHKLTCIHLDGGTRGELPIIGPCEYCVIRGNTVYDAGASLLEGEGSHYCHFVNNKCLGKAGVTDGYSCGVYLNTFATGNLVANNLVLRTHGGYGDNTPAGIGISAHATANVLLHNTLDCGGLALRLDETDGGAPDSCHVRVGGNVLVGGVRLAVKPSAIADSLWNHNCFATTGQIAEVLAPYGRTSSIAGWQDWGGGLNDIKADPALVLDVATGRLVDGSPCIGTASDGTDRGVSFEEETDMIKVEKVVPVTLTAYGKVDYDAENVPHVYECDDNGAVKGTPIGDFDIAADGKLKILPVEWLSAMRAEG